MKAGPMKTRLKILKPEKEIGKSRAEKTVFSEVKTVHAERIKLSGRYGLIIGEAFPDYYAEFNIRDAHEIDENWRVEEIGGKLYTVTNIFPNRDKGFLTLKCSRVNL